MLRSFPTPPIEYYHFFINAQLTITLNNFLPDSARVAANPVFPVTTQAPAESFLMNELHVKYSGSNVPDIPALGTQAKLHYINK